MSVERQHIHVTGVVQGVGFRPFVFGLARQLDLDGWVNNSSDGVDIEIEGAAEKLAVFSHSLRDQAPPLSHIDDLTITSVFPLNEPGFSIKKSISRPGASLISPDVATCKDCLREILDPTDHRYRYAFTNCTNCGPRFTIIEGIPYDRPMTTMREFPMCLDCQSEYDDPLDRRFHAQPNACPTCGPQVWMSTGTDTECNPETHNHGGDPFKAAASLLRLGGTMAIKGLGGFHLACDATNDEAVRWLRRRKGRSAKPFAVMMVDMEMIRSYCRVNEQEQALLTSPAAPIVLLWRKLGTDLALTIAPRNKTLGVMLPYTPLHHVLLREVGRPLVMTSGNHTDEPIAMSNQGAVNTIMDIADAFLFHNRRIHARCDDSVWMVPEIADGERQAFPIRRSRGYAPFPIKVAFQGKQPIFGAGAQMKNVFAVLKNDQVFLSQHIGELDNLETLDFYRSAIDHLSKIFDAPPTILAHDMHPDYLSTRYVREWADRENVQTVPVQHHHAHIASCLADNRINEPVIGVAFDGTGYGTDGHIWGSEFLIADMAISKRVGHLEYLPLPGGELAIRRPYRIALAYLRQLLGTVPALPFLSEISAEEQRIIEQQIQKGFNSPLTSSMGRLFDAVSALIGVRTETSYEAQAAIELEMIAASDPESNGAPPELWREKAYPFDIQPSNGTYQIRLGPIFEAIVGDLIDGASQTYISRRFHKTLAWMVLEMCNQLSSEHHLSTVALSGGCFQNRILFRLTKKILRDHDFVVLSHTRVPPNDGCIALGQVAVAAHQLDR